MKMNICIIRHGEKSFSDSECAGLTYQGGARAYNYLTSDFPTLIFGENSIYDIYTYGAPMSRAYFTVKELINNNKNGTNYIAKSKTDFTDIVEQLKKTKSKNILICWEHLNIQSLIQSILSNNQEDTITFSVPSYIDVMHQYRSMNLTPYKQSGIMFSAKITAQNEITIDNTPIKISDPDCCKYDASNDPTCVYDVDNEDIDYCITFDLIVERDHTKSLTLHKMKTYPNFTVGSTKTDDGYNYQVFNYGKPCNVLYSK